MKREHGLTLVSSKVMTIGQVYQLKETLKDIELTPSFYEVIKSYLGQHSKTKYADPSYVFDVTLLTHPLHNFLKHVLEALESPRVEGIFLTRGFGFGKTHAIIFLWHLLNSHEGMSSEIAGKIGLEKDVVEGTLVLGIDFSAEEDSFTQLLNQLYALAQREGKFKVKHPNLSYAVAEVMKKMSKSKIVSIYSEELAKLISDIFNIYENYYGGRPRLLILIDELGIGLVRKLEKYIQTENEEKYEEARRLLFFIEALSGILEGKGIPTVMIIALADQDLKAIEALENMVANKPEIQNKIKGIRDFLDWLRKRLSRARGGLVDVGFLSYDPEHMISIARHRVLKELKNETLARDSLLSYLASQAAQLNLQDILNTYAEFIKKYYPLSPLMIRLFEKLGDPRDAPRTEYVRTAIRLLAEALEHILKYEPDKALSIGVKHLTLARASLVDLMENFEADWASTLSDIEEALKSISPEEVQRVADIVAKQILAKGVTDRVLELVEDADLNKYRKYGVTIEEMQLDILAILPPEEAIKTLELTKGAVEALKIQSARIEERDYDEKLKFYMPSLMRTVYDKLAAFVDEEKKILNEPQRFPDYMQKEANIPSLFFNIKVSINGRTDDAVVLLKEYRKLSNVRDLLNDPEVREAQNKGKLSIIIIPSWDTFLFKELYGGGIGYENLLEKISRELQRIASEGDISRPLHIVILLPNLEKSKMDAIIERTASYMALKKFLNYLMNKEKIFEQKILSYEETIKKRLTRRLDEYYEEQRERIRKILKNLIGKQIEDAKLSAQRELIKLSREIVMEILELYKDAIIYDMQAQKFTHKNLTTTTLFSETRKKVEKYGERLKEVQEPLPGYSSAVNSFLIHVIELLGFEWKPENIVKALLEHYRTEASSLPSRKQDKISEIVENLMLGTYSVRPSSSNVAEEAVRHLNGKILDVEDRRIKFIVDEKFEYVKFEVEEMKSPVELEVTARLEKSLLEEELPERETTVMKGVPLEDVTGEVIVKVSESTNFEELRLKLDDLYKRFKSQISTVEVHMSSSTFKATFEFLEPEHDPGLILSISGFLVRLSKRYKSLPHIKIKFAKPLPKSKVQEILG